MQRVAMETKFEKQNSVVLTWLYLCGDWQQQTSL